MNNKNLRSEIVKPVSLPTLKNLPVELLELSEEELQRVVGGLVGEQDPPEKKPPEKKPVKWTFTAKIDYDKGWKGGVGVTLTF